MLVNRETCLSKERDARLNFEGVHAWYYRRMKTMNDHENWHCMMLMMITEKSLMSLDAMPHAPCFAHRPRRLMMIMRTIIFERNWKRQRDGWERIERCWERRRESERGREKLREGWMIWWGLCKVYEILGESKIRSAPFGLRCSRVVVERPAWVVLDGGPKILKNLKK